MKKFKTAQYIRQERGDNDPAVQIEHLPLPQNVKQALLTALVECDDPYCQQYIRALPKSYEYGKQINEAEHALKTQVNYVYANMEEYPNEQVKETLADYCEIPQQYRHGAEDLEQEDE